MATQVYVVSGSLGHGERSQGNGNAYQDGEVFDSENASEAEIAQLVGDVMMRIGRVDEAVSYYTAARRLEAPPAEPAAPGRQVATPSASRGRTRTSSSTRPGRRRRRSSR